MSACAKRFSLKFRRHIDLASLRSMPEGVNQRREPNPHEHFGTGAGIRAGIAPGGEVPGVVRQVKPGREGSDVDKRRQSGNFSDGTRQVKTLPGKGQRGKCQAFQEGDRTKGAAAAALPPNAITSTGSKGWRAFQVGKGLLGRRCSGCRACFGRRKGRPSFPVRIASSKQGTELQS